MLCQEVQALIVRLKERKRYTNLIKVLTSLNLRLIFHPDCFLRTVYQTQQRQRQHNTTTKQQRLLNTKTKTMEI